METYDYQPHNTSIFRSFSANWMAVICYVGYMVLWLIPGINQIAGLLSWILPLVVLFLERDSGLVRFSAAQSLVLSIAQAAINLILVIISAVTLGLGLLLTVPLLVILNLAFFVIQIICAVRAYQWKALRMPYLSSWAARLEAAIHSR